MRNSSLSKTKRLAKGIKKRREVPSISGFQRDTENGELLDSVGITNYMQDSKPRSRATSHQNEIQADANSEQ